MYRVKMFLFSSCMEENIVDRLRMRRRFSSEAWNLPHYVTETDLSNWIEVRFNTKMFLQYYERPNQWSISLSPSLFIPIDNVDLSEAAGKLSAIVAQLCGTQGKEHQALKTQLHCWIIVGLSLHLLMKTIIRSFKTDYTRGTNWGSVKTPGSPPAAPPPTAL